MEAARAFDLNSIQQDAASVIAGLKQQSLDHPEPVFAVLRRLRPVLLVNNFALVTRLADVQDVLVREDVFGVTPK